MTSRSDRPLLIGLHGRAGAGKDTVALMWGTSHGFQRVALADPLREALYELDPMLATGLTVRMLVDSVGWEAAKRHRLYGPEVRRLLQVLATEVVRDMISPTAWVDIAEQHITELRDAGSSVVVTDVRFPNEADMIRRLGGHIVRVDRLGPAESGSQHRSETASIHADLVLSNDFDLASLRQHAQVTISQIIAREARRRQESAA